jgi:hypothetical protein
MTGEEPGLAWCGAGAPSWETIMERHSIIARVLWLARIPLRLGLWAMHNARDHPHAIRYQDASASALWPRVREEEPPPRWRLSVD